MVSEANRAGTAPLLIVGGYGLVGEQAARLLRHRHPELPLLLGGRHPERARALAESIGASTVAIDVGSERPLGCLPEPPAAVLGAVSDPHDHLLIDAMRRGIPIADIHRAGHASILDVTVAAARERPAAPVLLAGGWLAGLAALMAAAAVRELGGAEHVEIIALSSSDDRVGPDSWGFSERLAWPYYAMRNGRRQPAHPMTDLRQVRCADLNERPAALIGTLEQTTLPLTLGVPTVETRMALQSVASLYGLVGLKRAGALRALARPGLRRLRTAVLQRPGSGDLAGVTVTAKDPTRAVSVELLDARGQAHLSAVGAAWAAERLLGPGLPAGISFPEQSAEPEADIEMVRQAGVTVRLSGFTKDVAHSHASRREVGDDGATGGRRTMNRSDVPGLLLCGLRAVGGAAFLAPSVGARKLGIPDDTEGTYLVRLFAARNVALIAGLLASRGEARRLWYQAGIACDALDVAAGLAKYRTGKERSAAVVDTTASLAALLLGVAGLVMEQRAKATRAR